MAPVKKTASAESGRVYTRWTSLAMNRTHHDRRGESAAAVRDDVWKDLKSARNQRAGVPAVFASSAGVHGRVRPAVAARVLRTSAGSTALAPCPHSRRM